MAVAQTGATPRLPAASPASTVGAPGAGSAQKGAAGSRPSGTAGKSTDQAFHVISIPGGEAWGASFSPDGKQVAVTGKGPQITVWDVESGKLVQTYSGHRTWAGQPLFTPDGKAILSIGDEGNILVQDAVTGKAIATLGEPVQRSTAHHLSCSHDGRLVALACRDGSIHLWDLQTRREVRTLKIKSEGWWASAFLPDDRTLACLEDEQGFGVWDVETGRRIRGGEGALYASALAVSPDGTQLLAGGGSGNIPGRPQVIYVYDLKTCRLLRKLTGHRDWIQSIAYSPKGRYAASGSGMNGEVFINNRMEKRVSVDNTVRLWNTKAGVAELYRFTGHTAQIHSVAYSPDGRYIASGSEDGTLRIWKVPDQYVESASDKQAESRPAKTK